MGHVVVAGALVAAVLAVLFARVAWPPAQDHSLLAGRKVLITGGGSGIGRELAVLLVRVGAHVVIAGRTRAKLDAVCEEANRQKNGASGGRCGVVTADAASLEGCQATVSEAVFFLGGLDVVISNHVTGTVAKLSELSDFSNLQTAYRKTFDANVFGLLCLAKAAEPHLTKSGKENNSSIMKPQFVQVSSISVFYGIARMSLYSGSKAAAHPIVNAFRIEMPHIAWSILNVGHVTTDIANAQMPEIAKQSGMPPDVCASYIADELILQEREVFFPATYLPFRFPGIVAFLGGTFFPSLMESISRATYGEDFVKALDDPNPMEKK